MINVKRKSKKTITNEEVYDEVEAGLIYGDLTSSYMGLQNLFQKYKK